MANIGILSKRVNGLIQFDLPNAWGLYDMHGNVDEWCLDWSATLTGGVDSVGAEDGSHRVARGGGWYCAASYCSSAYRYERTPPNRCYCVGVRVAATLGEEVSP